MIAYISTSEAIHELQNDDNANWTYDAAVALVEYYEQYEMDSGEDYRFNRVDIRCTFTNWASLAEFNECYGRTWDDIDALREYTEVIEYDGGLIVADF
jgi:hypothetical protein|tara:strand:+ start:966 stop:1259 length:294 start_codon:yes stop_codon:yes gene_type:complete